MLLLSQNDVMSCFNLETSLEAISRSLQDLAKGKAISPPRHTHLVKQDPFMALGLMPGFITNSLFGAKVTAVNMANRKNESDCHQGVVTLFDNQGQILVTADGATITALRTALVSCLASTLLAKRSSKKLVIFGSGLQAKLQAIFHCRLFPIEKIEFHSPRPIKELEELQHLPGLESQVVDIVKTHPSESIDADIICTVTDASAIILKSLKRHCHVNAIGASTAMQQEVSHKLIRRSEIIVEHKASAIAHCGELKNVETEHLKEIGALNPADDSIERTTIFKSVGIGLVDVAFLAHIASIARDQKKGTHFHLGGLHLDPAKLKL